MTRITDNEKRRFVQRHKLLFGRASRDKEAEMSVALLARKELGYSDKTSPCDILRGLQNAWKRQR